jgi:hypothetical protein
LAFASCPKPLADYNESMTGVDLANQYACRLTLWRQSKRYIMSFFLHFLNVAIANAWYLYQHFNTSNPDITLKDFRMQLAKELVDDGFNRKRRGRTQGLGPIASTLKLSTLSFLCAKTASSEPPKARVQCLLSQYWQDTNATRQEDDAYLQRVQ